MYKLLVGKLNANLFPCLHQVVKIVPVSLKLKNSDIKICKLLIYKFNVAPINLASSSRVPAISLISFHISSIIVFLSSRVQPQLLALRIKLSTDRLQIKGFSYSKQSFTLTLNHR